MIWIDYGIIGLIGIFAVIGLIRGFAAEAISLITWTVAFWIGVGFSRELSIYVRPVITHSSVRLAVSFGLLFLLTLILGRLLKYILRQLLHTTAPSGSDRFLGLLFGTGRGALVVAIFVLLAGLTTLPRDAWWRESRLISPFQSVVVWVKRQFPFGIAGKVDYRR